MWCPSVMRKRLLRLWHDFKRGTVAVSSQKSEAVSHQLVQWWNCRLKILKGLCWTWKLCWMGEWGFLKRKHQHLPHNYPQCQQNLKMIKLTQGERRCIGRLLSFPIRYDCPIHRGNNQAINPTYHIVWWPIFISQINCETTFLATDSTSSCPPSCG